MSARYLWIETKLVFRNLSFLTFVIALPSVLFLVYAGVFGGEGTYEDGTPVVASLMVSMAGYGAMAAALATGTQVAFERVSGWQRQLRLTRMSGLGYIAAKAVLAMMVALPVIALISVLGAAVTGVRLSFDQWLVATLGVWAAALPFTVLGILIGLVLNGEAAASVGGMLAVLLGFAGGMFFPSQVLPGWGQALMKAAPSYWLRDVGQSAFSDGAQVGAAVAVLAGYTVVLGALGTWRYLRDESR